MSDERSYAGLNVHVATAQAQKDGFKRVRVVSLDKPYMHSTADIDDSRITLVVDGNLVSSSYSG